MHLGKFFFILGAIFAFAFLATAQRMDSYEKSLTLRSLSRDLELLNSKKQELTTLIKVENDRLLLLSRDMGSPLVPGDVVILESSF